MRFLWLDINSSYSHSSLAFPALEVQLSDNQRERSCWNIISATLNSDKNVITAEAASLKPDFIFSTLWLFNSDYSLSVLKRIKSLLPDVSIILGGPEFLGENRRFLETNPEVSAVFRGEAEEMFPQFIQSILDNRPDFSIPGFCYLNNKREYKDNGHSSVGDFLSLVPAEYSVFFRFDKPFIQFETSRGCFNTCSFCVSGSNCSRVQFLPPEIIRQRLIFLKSKGVKDVRILDRTFNGNEKHAKALLKIFSDFSGSMKFHLEIHPAIIKEELREILKSMPADLLHVEAGIQSLDDTVLIKSGRAGNSYNSMEGLKFLLSLKLFEVHADLIAGLPGYSFNRLLEDYINLAGTAPDEIQTELLKVLPGTEFRRNASELGLKYSPVPPYEVLQTDCMTPQEMIMAIRLSRISDIWYNDKRWQGAFRILIAKYENFLSRFIDYLSDVSLSLIKPERAGSILFDFCSCFFPDGKEIVSHAWIVSGLALNKKPAGNIRKWEIGFSGLINPFDNITDEYSYYYLEVSSGIIWYSFRKGLKNLPPENTIIK